MPINGHYVSPLAPTASPVYQGGQSVTGLPTSYTQPAHTLDIGSLFRPNPIAKALFNYVFNEEAENCPTDHANDRSKQAESDKHRQVGDPSNVINSGRKFFDTDTGHTVHVNEDRVVITNRDGRRVTQFKNTKKILNRESGEVNGFPNR